MPPLLERARRAAEAPVRPRPPQPRLVEPELGGAASPRADRSHLSTAAEARHRERKQLELLRAVLSVLGPARKRERDRALPEARDWPPEQVPAPRGKGPPRVPRLEAVGATQLAQRVTRDAAHARPLAAVPAPGRERLCLGQVCQPVRGATEAPLQARHVHPLLKATARGGADHAQRAAPHLAALQTHVDPRVPGLAHAPHLRRERRQQPCVPTVVQQLRPPPQRARPPLRGERAQRGAHAAAGEGVVCGPLTPAVPRARAAGAIQGHRGPLLHARLLCAVAGVLAPRADGAPPRVAPQRRHHVGQLRPKRECVSTPMGPGAPSGGQRGGAPARERPPRRREGLRPPFARALPCAPAAALFAAEHGQRALRDGALTLGVVPRGQPACERGRDGVVQQVAQRPPPAALGLRDGAPPRRPLAVVCLERAHSPPPEETVHERLGGGVGRGVGEGAPGIPRVAAAQREHPHEHAALPAPVCRGGAPLAKGLPPATPVGVPRAPRVQGEAEAALHRLRVPHAESAHRRVEGGRAEEAVGHVRQEQRLAPRGEGRRRARPPPSDGLAAQLSEEGLARARRDPRLERPPLAQPVRAHGRAASGDVERPRRVPQLHRRVELPSRRPGRAA